MDSDKPFIPPTALKSSNSSERGTTNPETLTYFYSLDQMYYYDSYNNVYRADGTLIHESNSFALGLNLLEPDFRIEGIPYYFDAEHNLISPDEDSTLQLVQTWKGPAGQHPSMLVNPGAEYRAVQNIFLTEDESGEDSDSYQDVKMILFDPVQGSTLPGLALLDSNPFNPKQKSGPESTKILEKWREEAAEAQSLPAQPHKKPSKEDRRRCPFCNKMFRRPSSLEDHLNIHSGDKPHICPFSGCNTGFATRSNMKRHFLTHRIGSLETYHKANPRQSQSSTGSARGYLANRTPSTCRSDFLRGTSPIPSAYLGAGPSSNPFRGPQLAFESNPTKTYIGQNTTLAKICQYLIDNGCRDISKKLARIDNGPTFTGELSDIFRGELTNGTIVAVKRLRPPTNRNNQPDKTLKRTAYELCVWSLMAHQNVLGFLGFAICENKLALVIPWVKYRSLISYLDENTQVDRCELCTQVGDGLAYVHSLDITHGDLKGDNIAVSEDGTAKITNFASATMKREFPIAFTATRSLHYSIRWAAPELFSGISGLESDVYALGMTILEALTGHVPYKDHGDLAIIHAVMVRKVLPGRPMKELSPHSKQGNTLWRFLQRCWNHSPALRPTSAEVRDFLREIHPSDLEEPQSDTFPMEIQDLKIDSPSTISSQSPDETTLPTPIQIDVQKAGNEASRPASITIDAKIENTRHPEFIIKRDTDLRTIIKYLVDNGCIDVTSQLTNISEYFSGRQSDVYRSELRDGTAVAVKCLRELTNPGNGPNKILKHTARELYTWSISSHPNVLGLVGLAIVRDKLAMVAPWMEYGSLLAYTDANPKADRCNLCTQIAEGLTYMHALGVAHGDMKGDNVVVSKEGVVKITDFGCATMKREFPVTFTATESLQYSVRWAAPEMFLEDGATTFETDVYAFGMAGTILEVLSGDIPYKERGDLAVIQTVLVKKELPNRPCACISPTSTRGDEVWNLMQRCWNMEPKLRPTMGEVKNFVGLFT
ncbi:Proto-oncogene tyrosine-protein kinase ROS [Rhizoctonia solani]|uniref:Proto-oncogene tyrosine-protein kinase ROS n=1 Tax=Rhizoctonia solani TaxID=456999 RepID=A0A0K6FRI9_9AGAM|nr:Proto-oncogene tyrosine-protein kinase ROS [Rhizoctonia solani]